MLRSLVLLTALTASAGALAADKYAIDPGHSQVRFGYNHMGFSNIVASFESINGEILFDSADITKSSVTVTVPIASLRSGVVKLDQHLQSADFFDMSIDIEVRDIRHLTNIIAALRTSSVVSSVQRART